MMEFLQDSRVTTPVLAVVAFLLLTLFMYVNGNKVKKCDDNGEMVMAHPSRLPNGRYNRFFDSAQTPRMWTYVPENRESDGPGVVLIHEHDLKKGPDGKMPMAFIKNGLRVEPIFA